MMQTCPQRTTAYLPQALQELAKVTSARDLELMLPSWSYLYQRLAMDNTR